MADKSKTYKLEISYIGTDFNGFQSQPCGNTIQDIIEDKIFILLKEPLRIRGASRTDSGVHAFHQIACFQTAQALKLDKFHSSLNALLPKAISVKSISQINSDFHPIHTAKAKLYRYSLWKGRCYNPFLKDFVWQVDRKIKTDLLRDRIQDFLGTHDFTSFCSSDSESVSKTRTIYEVKVVERENCVDLWFLGQGFLKQMIRIQVGTLVDLALEKNSQIDIIPLLKLQDRNRAGQTAPARGLTLVDIFYENIPTINGRLQRFEQNYFLSI